MKLIIAFIFIFLILNPVLSQQPSKEQMQAQMKQAKLEMQQQITDLEKQIAEAKKNNETPETIKELEDQLALMKKMSGIVDKAETINRTPPKELPTTNTIAAYKSPYIQLIKGPVIAATEAQAKDHLLWYKGRKINANTLVTTAGRVVQYDRKNNRVIVQPNEKKDSSFIKIVKNLTKSRQWTNTYVDNKSAEKNSFFDYPMVMMVMKEYDLIEKGFDKIANNTLELPGTGTDPRAEIFYKSASYANSGPSANSADSTDPWLQQEYEEIMSRVNNPPPLDVYPPPKQEYSLCYYCDVSALESYEREKEIWSNGFNEYEVGIISRCLSIYRYFSLSKGDDYEDLMNPGMLADLKKAEKFANDRMDKKIEMLQKQYGDDIYRYTAVISTVLSWKRQKALLGASDNDNFSPPEFEIFKNQTFEKFIADRIAANDYDVIFNYAMINGFARNKALLGYVDDEHDTYWPMIEAVVNHNRFALTLDLDFQFQMGEDEAKPDLKANGILSTKQKIYLKLGRTEDCKWQFYLFDADYSMMTQEKAYKLPIIFKSGTKMVRQGDTWITYPYSGPTDLLMVFPSFRISFCNGANKDSAMIDILRYEQENVTGDSKKAYTVDMLGYANKMFVSIEDTKANQDQIADVIDKMVDVSSHQGTVDNPTGYAKLDKMQMDFKTNSIQQGLQKRVTETSKVNNTVILFDAQNGSPFLINSTTNTANNELSQNLKKGIIKLKVVLEPL